jgi:putative SOS response-associated peptidase YedK
MCGRFTLRTPAYKLAEAFGIEVRANLAARYNIAPSQDIAALRVDGENQRELVMLRWGLVPRVAKDAGWFETALPHGPPRRRAFHHGRPVGALATARHG